MLKVLKSKKLKAVLIIIALAIGMLVFLWSQKKTVVDSGNSSVFPISFYDAATFKKSLGNLDKESLPVKENIRGGILPHYLLPMDEIMQFYAILSKSQSPKTIILLGPDHADANRFGAAAADAAWQTEFGRLEPDREVITEITNSGLVSLDNDSFRQEHSIASHVHFIKYFFPQAKIVPIIFRSDYPEEKALALSSEISKLANNDVLVLASIDFSHYLKNQEAQAYDAITLETMKKYDYNSLYTYDNKYLDSPAAIVTILKTMQNLGAGNLEVYKNSNSGAMANDYNMATTSYFLIYFSK